MTLSLTDYELKTERLFLRPLKVADLEMLWPYVSDPEIPKYMCWNVHENRNVTKEFLKICEKSFPEESINWAIFWDEEFCGLIGIEIISKIHDVQLGRAELGYWLGREFWGQGIVVEAARAVIDFGFRSLKLHKITVGHFVENKKSQRVIEKLGFRYVGEQKAQFLKEGKWHDQKIYEMLEGGISR